MKIVPSISISLALAVTGLVHAEPVEIASSQNRDNSMYTVKAVIDLDLANGTAVSGDSFPGASNPTFSRRYEGGLYGYAIEGAFGRITDTAVIVTAINNITLASVFQRNDFYFNAPADVLKIRPAGVPGDNGAGSVYLVGDPNWFGADEMPQTLDGAAFGSYTDNGAPFFLFSSDDLPADPPLDNWRQVQITSLGNANPQHEQVPLGAPALALLAFGLGVAGFRRLG